MKLKHDLHTSEQMRAEMKRKLEAGERLGASHNGPPLPDGMVIAGSIMTPEQMGYTPEMLTRRKSKQRKHISEKSCKGGHTCMPGLGGKCVACSEDDEA